MTLAWAILAESAEPAIWPLIFAGGAFGGLLCGMRDRKLKPPSRNPDGTFEPGWIADLAFGLGGGCVIFLLLPGSFSELTGWEAVKVLATAIVGGYGGRSVMDRMLAEALKKAETAEKKAAEAQAAVEDRSKQDDLDRRAMALVLRQLTGERGTPAVPFEELAAAVAECSAAQRARVFYEAAERRSRTWRDDKQRMERTIPVFRALIACDEKGQYHQNHGQLGFALKDKQEPDYDGAEAELTKAMEIRGDPVEKGWFIYELARAIARIERGGTATPPEQVLEDLRTAACDAGIWDDIIRGSAKKPIQAWLKAHGYSWDDLRES